MEDRDKQIHAEYDLFGNITRRSEAFTELSFRYDKEGRLRKVVNEAGEAYYLVRDGEGDLAEETGFDGLSREYHRDYTGLVREMVINGKYTTTYRYDDGNRIAGITRYDGTEEQYGYDVSGSLVKAENSYSVVAFERDIMGRVIRETCNGHEITSLYGASGRRVRVQSSLGADIEADYDPFGDLVSLASGEWNAGYRRDAMGLEIERTLPGNLRRQIERDDLGRVREQNLIRDYTGIDKKSYLWGTNDRLLSVIDNGRERQYEYDGRGKLAKTIFEDGKEEYRNPDKTGNLFETKDFSDRRYATGGQLIKTREWEYKYDEFGNLVRKKDKHGATWRYEWNGAGMLKRVKRPDAREVIFRYDALGRRIAKQFGNVVTRWVWDGNVPLHEQKSNYYRDYAEEKGEFLREEKQQLVTWVFEEGTFVPAAKITDRQRLSIVANYMGTPEAMYREDGEAVWTCELNSYGKVRKFQGEYKTDCPFRYQGQYEDSETGLYYNRFRYYSPDEGMYISQDPIRLNGGTNLYSYVQDTNGWVDIFGFIEEFGIAGYGSPVHRNDGLTAHELLQNGWLRNNGKINSRLGGIAKDNPAIAMQEKDMHGIISQMQREAGLHNPETLKNQSALENIQQNAEITREGMIRDLVENRGWERANAEDYATRKVAELQEQAEEFARKNKLCD